MGHMNAYLFQCSCKCFNKAFAAALVEIDKEENSKAESDYMANNVIAEPEYSDSESVDTSDSTELKAHAVRVYESLKD